ncbi:MAG: hypothetical protein KGO47_05430 [Cyanobacteria bacterium REEB417]|nr:hypothetical protein [Cyanobacteria bacterium REEB417]
MNMAEVIVASSLFLSACGGAAQIGSSSAQAMAQSRHQFDVMETIEAQLLAVAPVLQGAVHDGPAHDCGSAAQWMQQQLASALPPLSHGVERQLSLAAGGQQVMLVLRAPNGLRRERLYSPVGFGLCGGPAVVPQFNQELGDASF